MSMSKARLTGALVAAALAAVGSYGAAVALGREATAAGHCHGLRLKGLSVAAARARAQHAHCALRFKGAKIRDAKRQTVTRQQGDGGRLLTLWVGAMCDKPEHEPVLTAGPTELVSGLYAGGGPPVRGPQPCPTPGSGTITVTNAANGEVVARQPVSSGSVATIPLPPGEYSIVGTFTGVIVNGQPAQSPPQAVTIPAGTTVRQDLEFSYP
jgi:hypothetical protein